ncbi:hypothetical protein HK098_003448 [Nowakowskiella sp. JEL0407]|nr:hypothetical protein HK098_003448 [Nowakowskiella sp. JEL0407]
MIECKPYPSFYNSKLDMDPPRPSQDQESLYSEFFNVNFITVAELTTFTASGQPTFSAYTHFHTTRQRRLIHGIVKLLQSQSETYFGPVVIGSPYISASTGRATVTASSAIFVGGIL